MSLIDKSFIKEFITAKAPWCESHGAELGTEKLGAGILYYGLTYAFQPKTCVCLGSGGGFVPRLMRQAQRDLGLERSRTVLVDGATNVDEANIAIWGNPRWLPEESHFRQNYPEIDIRIALTEDAFRDYFEPNQVTIDYLHIDADHHYEGVKLDWDLYRTLVPDHGIITLHDTVNYRVPCGVYQLMDEIREQGEYEMINFPIKYGTAILRKRQADGRPADV
ncbi:MAG: class I SAM-dependent methyltransferase [Planctomycetales bacterium]|nr:class I SAM-dependent methyltransferase [Planctomycetales bacterium]